VAIVTLDTHDATPIYAQLDRALRAAIASGRLAVGDQLPTVRALAVDLRVNANTVARVYGELERAGVLETRRGVGTFVLASAPQARSVGEHKRRLHAFATRVTADAASQGFTMHELVTELTTLRKGGS
jgi:GntR family transcriptional regulator